MTVEEKGIGEVIRKGVIFYITILAASCIAIAGVTSYGFFFIDDFVAGEPGALATGLAFTILFVGAAYFWTKR